ncbi:MAG: C39 family peptidase [Anaerolineae bacterium]
MKARTPVPALIAAIMLFANVSLTPAVAADAALPADVLKLLQALFPKVEERAPVQPHAPVPYVVAPKAPEPAAPASAGSPALEPLPVAAPRPAPVRVPAGVNDQLRAQTEVKHRLVARLRELSPATARLGEPVDAQQVSVRAPVERGQISLDDQGAYAYIQPYREPNDWAHVNYCAAGAATVLLSHWDAALPQNVNLDELGEEIGIDPSAGAWVRDIVKPVNQRLNALLGEDLNWYRYGQARSLEDFRWIVEYDIQQHGVPFITSLNTGGLPGWSSDVGHIVCVYGYTRSADGTEYVSYADTAPPLSGYTGYVLRTVELEIMWQAVSANSAQVW